MKFRAPDRGEETILKQAFSKWGIFEHYATSNLFISVSETTPDNKKVYFCSESFKSLDTFLESDPVSIGLQIGIMRKKKFVAGLNFAELVLCLIYKENEKLCFPYIIITDKAVNLVCFGRDIMGNSIIHCSDDIVSNQMLMILNHNYELVGLGRARFPSDLLFKANLVTVDTVENIGTYYLQQENFGLTE